LQIDASHLSYTVHTRHHCQGIVKVHGVFPSCCGEAVSSPPLQFHRVCGRDSAQVVTPFMHVGTYPTRNFATLGPSDFTEGWTLPCLLASSFFSSRPHNSLMRTNPS